MEINVSKLNPLAKFFLPDAQQEVEAEVKKNAHGLSEQDIEYINNYGSYTETAVFGSETIDFQEAFGNKFARKIKYREMSFYPEICQVIDAYSDEAIILDENQKIADLNIRKEVPKKVLKQMKANWDYIMYEVFKAHERGWEWFRKWLVEAELYVELVTDKNGKGIIGYKILPSATTFPVYSGNRIVGFVQQNYDVVGTNANGNSVKKFTANQVAYANYGVYGRSSLDVLGYLEQAIRTYNQLRGLEDSLVVYRMARAPERRVWNIEVNKMSPGKANEFIKKLMQKYRRRSVYDPNSGEIDSVKNTQAIIDDYWFPKRHGEGSTIETIGGNIEIGKLDDVNHFLGKLYKSLRYPRSRWVNETSEPYSFMKPGEIDRDEVTFTRAVNRNRMRFGSIYMQAFMHQNRLTLSKNDAKKYNNSEYLSIRFVEDNALQLHKEYDMLQTRFDMLSNVAQYIKTEENMDGFLDQEFALKKYFKMTQDEFQENQEMLKKNKLPESTDDDGNDLGDSGDDEDDW